MVTAHVLFLCEIKKVFVEGKRPELDRRWPEGLGTLIESCWHAKPNVRPNSSQVVKVLLHITKQVNSANPGASYDRL